MRWMRVTEEGHPALGEHGLFAARKLAPGERCVDYLGLVTLNGNESETSDYSATFGDEHELALDAATVGNEARMCNDYRGTGRRPNAVFDQYRDAAGDLKLAIFVGPKPVAKGEELLRRTGKGSGAPRRRLGAFRAATGSPTRARAKKETKRKSGDAGPTRTGETAQMRRRWINPAKASRERARVSSCGAFLLTRPPLPRSPRFPPPIPPPTPRP